MGGIESGGSLSFASRVRIYSKRLWNFTPRFASLFFLYLVFATLLVLRRPDCVHNPQFWAEEGSRFFREAQERPAWSNLTSYTYGYFDLLLRIINQIAVLVPLESVPLAVVLLAIAMQAAVPAFVVSSRCEGWMGVFPIRLTTALLYCAMPNSFETHCIQLHSRVHLAVLGSLVIVSAPPRSLRGKLFDLATLTLSGLSGPFALLLAPAAVWRYWKRRTPATKRNCLVLLVPTVLEIFALVSSTGQRFGQPLGASLREGIRIVGGQFTVGFFLGEKTYAAIVHQPWFDVVAWISFLGIAILTLLIARREETETRYLLFIGLGSLAMALASPIAAVGMTQWHALWAVPGCGQRYYFPPMAMLLFALAAVAGRGKSRSWRGLAMVLLVLIAGMGARIDFVLPAFTDFHFDSYAKLYRSIPAGSSITFPINPPGWEMQLRKPPQ